jgi:cytoskeleton protein RodZ
MNSVVETLGARLRAERERKGLSTQKAADDLHLDGWVIDALEADDYARIGPSVYGKGHLKRYAELLGLPVSDIMAAYDGRTAAPAMGAAVHASTLRMPASDAQGQETPWALIGAAAALVLLAAATVFWWKPWSVRAAAPPAAAALPASLGNPNPAGAPSTAATEEEPAPDTVVGLPPMRDAHAGAARSTVAATAETTAKATVAATGANPSLTAEEGDGEAVRGMGKARLRLSFSADSWVDVHDAAGRRLFAGSGRANSVKTIAGEAPLKVYLGFASGVQVEVNSRVVAIGPQFITGDVAHFDAGADGVLRRDSHASAAASPRPRG